MGGKELPDYARAVADDPSGKMKVEWPDNMCWVVPDTHCEEAERRQNVDHTNLIKTITGKTGGKLFLRYVEHAHKVPNKWLVLRSDKAQVYQMIGFDLKYWDDGVAFLETLARDHLNNVVDKAQGEAMKREWVSKHKFTAKEMADGLAKAKAAAKPKGKGKAAAKASAKPKAKAKANAKAKAKANARAADDGDDDGDDDDDKDGNKGERDGYDDEEEGEEEEQEKDEEPHEGGEEKDEREYSDEPHSPPRSCSPVAPSPKRRRGEGDGQPKSTARKPTGEATEQAAEEAADETAEPADGAKKRPARAKRPAAASESKLVNAIVGAEPVSQQQRIERLMAKRPSTSQGSACSAATQTPESARASSSTDAASQPAAVEQQGSPRYRPRPIPGTYWDGLWHFG